ncbi:hypothetical protein E4T56_gene4541 [Termitomyces sp. T112]|nr:hypothetical protein E4T56_gene4541 [Termitomyces sp. T112]
MGINICPDSSQTSDSVTTLEAGQRLKSTNTAGFVTILGSTRYERHPTHVCNEDGCGDCIYNGAQKAGYAQEPTNHHNGQGYSSDRTPRRTPMACQFCRGRKLKCDGLRPLCSNCNKRGCPCVYAPVGST